MSDIHGDYGKYVKMLDLIHFHDDDILYILGDVVDRGLKPMMVLKDMMMRPNVIPLIGNHEYMALQCLRFLMSEVTEENISQLNLETMQGLMEWLAVGGKTTLDEFSQLTREEKQDILDYLEEFILYEQITVNHKNFILVHAGIDHFDVNKPLEDYSLYELIFKKPDYSKQYFQDQYLVTGHTPTSLIQSHSRPHFIYQKNHHIAIDCGCGYGGQLGAICLDTGEEFYIDE